jgi:ribonuclease HII
VDEAGRGPLAGPVVAAAVILPVEWIERGLPPPLHGLNDSKQLTAAQRETFFARLTAADRVLHAVAITEVAVIDALNILRASHQAMAEAIGRLSPPPDHLLVDGLPVPALPGPQTAVIKGDGLSFSIAAASVLAKVTRDRLMLEHDRRWPVYGFARHKGYPTPEHLAALERHGPCPIHRRSFAPVRARQGELFG